jgi:hypothetical protein
MNLAQICHLEYPLVPHRLYHYLLTLQLTCDWTEYLKDPITNDCPFTELLALSYHYLQLTCDWTEDLKL